MIMHAVAIGHVPAADQASVTVTNTKENRINFPC